MSSLYQTTDGVTVKLENNKVVGPDSKFHGREVKTDQDIMEIFGINVMKQPKASGGVEDTMILPDGTVVPKKIPAQPMTSGGTRDTQIRPDGSLYMMPQMKPNMPMTRPNMGQITGSGMGSPSYPVDSQRKYPGMSEKTKPLDLRRMLLANFTGLI